ncbi:MAG: hypothetical protein ACTHNU_06160 [Gaiellales bacterium]
MGVTYELIDAPYPYLCAVYRCPCGAVAVRHADQAAVPPPGWFERDVAGAEECLCPTCAGHDATVTPKPG